jgi:hypothetical protein
MGAIFCFVPLIGKRSGLPVKSPPLMPTPTDQSNLTDSAHTRRGLSPRQPYRVLLGKPGAIRVVIPEQLVVQPGLPIQVSPLLTQVLRIACLLRYRLVQQFPPRAVLTLPADMPSTFRHPVWRTVRPTVESENIGSSNIYSIIFIDTKNVHFSLKNYFSIAYPNKIILNLDGWLSPAATIIFTAQPSTLSLYTYTSKFIYLYEGILSFS